MLIKPVFNAMGEPSNSRLYGVFCPHCGVCFFPSDFVKVGGVRDAKPHRYEDLDLRGMGESNTPVVDVPVYHIECVN